MSSFFNDIDVRKEIKEIIEGNKISVLYVRTDTNSRCRCYDPLHKDGNSDCKLCGGKGILSSIEKMDVFLNPISMDDKSSGKTRTEIGDANLMTNIFYLGHSKKPKTGDRILIVGYDRYGLPTEVKDVSVIGVCREVRGFNGRVEMYKVMAKTSPQSLTLNQKRLNNIPNADKKKLMKGVRYQWGS